MTGGETIRPRRAHLVTRTEAAVLLLRAPTTVLPGGTRGLCAAVSGVPSAEGPDTGKRRGPGSAEDARREALCNSRPFPARAE